MTKGFSYSQLSTAALCLRKYKHQYVDKLTPGGLDSGDMAFGSALHAGLQAVLEEDSAYMEIFSMLWGTHENKQLEYGRFDWDTLAAMGKLFLERFVKLHKKRFGPAFLMEERLYADLHGISMEGTPDFVGDYDGIPSVVDFKTAGYEYPKEKIVANQQMYLYAYLIGKAKHYVAKQIVYVVFIKSQQRIQVLKTPLSPELLEDRLKDLVSLANAVTNTRPEHFYRNPANCMMGKYRCGFWEKCYGREVEDGAEALKGSRESGKTGD